MDRRRRRRLYDVALRHITNFHITKLGTAEVNTLSGVNREYCAQMRQPGSIKSLRDIGGGAPVGRQPGDHLRSPVNLVGEGGTLVSGQGITERGSNLGDGWVRRGCWHGSVSCCDHVQYGSISICHYTVKGRYQV